MSRKHNRRPSASEVFPFMLLLGMGLAIVFLVARQFGKHF